MPIIATAGDSTSYPPAPEGTHHAVCVDVIDVGMKANPFKDGQLQRKIDIAWQIDEARDDSKLYVLYKRYTLSLNEKATLRHDLESWRGKVFTRQEELGFDVEQVIGANCLINVTHKAGTKDASKTFANVVSVMPLVRGMVRRVASGYVRQQDQHPDADAVGDDVTVDEIPF